MADGLLRFLREIPQVYPAMALFLVLFASAIAMSTSGADTVFTTKLWALVEALFWALIGGFSLGQRPAAAVEATVTGPVTVERAPGPKEDE